MPKILVEYAELTTEDRKRRDCEIHLAKIVRAFTAHDVEGTARAFEAAVEWGGDEFLEFCRKLPAQMRKMLPDLTKLARS